MQNLLYNFPVAGEGMNCTLWSSLPQEICRHLHHVFNEDNETLSFLMPLISIAPHLSILYLNWTDLKNHEKCTLNRQIKLNFVKNGKIIYPPIVRAFEYWDMVQDTYGAPGFNCNPLKTELDKETDTSIVNMLFIMEQIVNQIYLKRKLLIEMLSHKDRPSILINYKWRIICKNMNNKRSHLTSTSKTGENSEHTRFSDLNGCGDMRWFSDF